MTLREPTGNSPLAKLLKELVRGVNEARINSVVGGRFARGPSGTTLVIDRQNSANPSITFETWQQGSDATPIHYLRGQCRCIPYEDGAGAGTYQCLENHQSSDTSPNSPSNTASLWYFLP
jgi:hypothetical protein